MQLIWNEEFDYEGFPDPEKWTFEIQDPKWVNEELQHYVKDLKNCHVVNNFLTIKAHYNQKSHQRFTSSRIKTQFKGDWLYGRMEIRALIPQGRGTWPAIWAMPTHSKYGDWPKSGEIDIMEHVGHNPGFIHGSIHCADYCWKQGTEKSAKIYKSSVKDRFHTYFLNWSENKIEIGIDNQIYFEYQKPNRSTPANWPFDQPFYLILNIAIGGTWGGEKGIDKDSFPQKMLIDYVRIYR